MKHLSLEIEKLEERIAPGVVCIPCCNQSKGSHDSKEKHSKEDHSKGKCGHK
jgi:hypothetical protein